MARGYCADHVSASQTDLRRRLHQRGTAKIEQVPTHPVTESAADVPGALDRAHMRIGVFVPGMDMHLFFRICAPGQRLGEVPDALGNRRTCAARCRRGYFVAFSSLLLFLLQGLAWPGRTRQVISHKKEFRFICDSTCLSCVEPVQTSGNPSGAVAGTARVTWQPCSGLGSV